MVPVADTSAVVREMLGKKVSPVPNTAYFALEVNGEILVEPYLDIPIRFSGVWSIDGGGGN